MKKMYTLLSSVFCAFGMNAQVILTEDFSTATGSAPPAGWNAFDLSSSGVNWVFDNPGERIVTAPITNPAAVLDSDFFGDTLPEDAVLVSPAFDASAVNGSLILEFDHQFIQYITSIWKVEVFNGTNWTAILSGNENISGPEHLYIDITSAANGAANARVRFHWTGVYDFYWFVDNVTISSVCAPVVVTAFPWTENFDDTEVDELPCGWLAENVNGDSYIWKVNSYNSSSGTTNALYIRYNISTAMNDWAYTPEMVFQAGVNYQLQFKYASSGAIYPESMRVRLGSAQANVSMTQELIDIPQMTNDTFITATTNFTVPTNGSYYIGFHGYSNMDEYYIVVDDINITRLSGAGVNESALTNIELFPNPSTGLVHVVSPVSNGALNVSVIDFSGKTVIALPGSFTGAFDIDLSTLGSGVYFVNVASQGVRQMHRIVLAQ